MEGGVGERPQAERLDRVQLLVGHALLVDRPQRGRGQDRVLRLEREGRDVLLLDLAGRERREDEADVDHLVRHAVVGVGERAERAAIERLHLERAVGIGGHRLGPRREHFLVHVGPRRRRRVELERDRLGRNRRGDQQRGNKTKGDFLPHVLLPLVPPRGTHVLYRGKRLAALREKAKGPRYVNCCEPLNQSAPGSSPRSSPAAASPAAPATCRTGSARRAPPCGRPGHRGSRTPAHR